MEWISVLLLTLSAGIASINGQSCSSEGQLRLFQTTSVSSSNAGRVEICMGGVWGTIAADSIATPWNEKNAQVACIQLGFTGALNGIRPNTIPFAEHPSSPIHLKSVLCDGTESNITSCINSNNVESNLGHGQDVFVVCRPQQGSDYSVVHPGGVQPGDIRLFGDNRNGRGAVQIYSITMGWLGICPDSSWTDSDAITICRDLGYDSGSAIAIDATNGPGGQVPTRRLYDAKCPATNNDVIRAGVCSFRVQSSPSGCTAPDGRFAAVQCSAARDQSVRLIGGSHSREGIVEIAYSGRWGMVCNTDFGQVDARTICKGLGYGDDDVSVISVSESSPILANESNLRPIWLDMLSCSSSDSSLSACVQESNIIGYADCLRTPGSSIVVVDCGNVNESSGLSGGAIAGIVIGSLFAVGLLVFIVTGGDKQKKKNQAAAAARARALQSQNQTALAPIPPPEPQPAPQPAADPESRQEPEPEHKFNLKPPVPQSQEPSAPELSKPPPPFVYDVQPDYPTNPQDEPPPYPGGPSAPAAYPAAGYPQQTYPVSWNDPAYPPASVPYPVTDSAPYPP